MMYYYKVEFEGYEGVTTIILQSHEHYDQNEFDKIIYDALASAAIERFAKGENPNNMSFINLYHDEWFFLILNEYCLFKAEFACTTSLFEDMLLSGESRSHIVNNKSREAVEYINQQIADYKS